MSLARTKSKTKEPRTKITWKEIKRQKVLLFWAAIIVAYGVIFYYLPLAGWAMAFQNYKPKLGILHSEFVGIRKIPDTVLRYDVYPCYPEYSGNGSYQSCCNFRNGNCVCNFIK